MDLIIIYKSRKMLLSIAIVLTVTSLSSASLNTKIGKDFVSEFIDKNGPQIAISQIVTRAVQWRMQEEMKVRSQKRPIISPIEDPLIIPELINTPININIPELISIVGNLLIGETQIDGLSELVDDFRLSMPIVVIPMSVNWTMNLPTATLSGPFTLDGSIKIPDAEAVLLYGNGDAKGSVESVFFRMNAVGRAPAYGNMELQHLDVDLGFKNFLFALDGLMIDGVNNDLSFIAPLIETIFGVVWNDVTRPVVNEMIRCSLDHTVHKCNIQNLIQGYWGCLEFTLNPKCFGEEEPEPTTTTEGDNQPSTSTDGNSQPSTSTESDDETTTSTNEPDPSAGGGSSSYHYCQHFGSLLFCILTTYVCLQ